VSGKSTWVRMPLSPPDFARSSASFLSANHRGSERCRAVARSGEGGLSRNTPAGLDREIDAFVYRLYELTPNEIALREQRTAERGRGRSRRSRGIDQLTSSTDPATRRPLECGPIDRSDVPGSSMRHRGLRDRPSCNIVGVDASYALRGRATRSLAGYHPPGWVLTGAGASSPRTRLVSQSCTVAK
jgi:hypothetical protein